MESKTVRNAPSTPAISGGDLRHPYLPGAELVLKVRQSPCGVRQADNSRDHLGLVAARLTSLADLPSNRDGVFDFDVVRFKIGGYVARPGALHCHQAWL